MQSLGFASLLLWNKKPSFSSGTQRTFLSLLHCSKVKPLWLIHNKRTGSWLCGKEHKFINCPKFLFLNPELGHTSLQDPWASVESPPEIFPHPNGYCHNEDAGHGEAERLVPREVRPGGVDGVVKGGVGNEEKHHRRDDTLTYTLRKHLQNRETPRWLSVKGCTAGECQFSILFKRLHWWGSLKSFVKKRMWKSEWGGGREVFYNEDDTHMTPQGQFLPCDIKTINRKDTARGQAILLDGSQSSFSSH